MRRISEYTRAFIVADKNKNGVLSASEAEAAFKKMDNTVYQQGARAFYRYVLSEQGRKKDLSLKHADDQDRFTGGLSQNFENGPNTYASVWETIYSGYTFSKAQRDDVRAILDSIAALKDAE